MSRDIQEQIQRARIDMSRRTLGVTMTLLQTAEYLQEHPLLLAARIAERSLVAVPLEGVMHFPLWQFDGQHVVRGLPAVLRALKGTWMTRAVWLITPSDVFEGKSPMEVLRSGKIEWVVNEARALYEDTDVSLVPG